MSSAAIDLGIISREEAQDILTLILAKVPLVICGTTGSGRSKLMEWVQAQAGDSYIYPSNAGFGYSLPEWLGLSNEVHKDVLVRGAREVDEFFGWFIREAQPLGKGMAFSWQLLRYEDVQESLNEVLAALGRHMLGHNLTGVALHVAEGRLLKIVPFRGSLNRHEYL